MSLSFSAGVSAAVVSTACVTAAGIASASVSTAAIAATGVTATASVSTFARIGVRCRRLVVRVWRAANRADALAERMIVCKLAR